LCAANSVLARTVTIEAWEIDDKRAAGQNMNEIECSAMVRDAYGIPTVQ
jgi:hypothetical protein